MTGQGEHVVEKSYVSGDVARGLYRTVWYYDTHSPPPPLDTRTHVRAHCKFNRNAINVIIYVVKSVTKMIP